MIPLGSPRKDGLFARKSVRFGLTAGGGAGRNAGRAEVRSGFAGCSSLNVGAGPSTAGLHVSAEDFYFFWDQKVKDSMVVTWGSEVQWWSHGDQPLNVVLLQNGQESMVNDGSAWEWFYSTVTRAKPLNPKRYRSVQ